MYAIFANDTLSRCHQMIFQEVIIISRNLKLFNTLTTRLYKQVHIRNDLEHCRLCRFRSVNGMQNFTADRRDQNASSPISRIAADFASSLVESDPADSLRQQDQAKKQANSRSRTLLTKEQVIEIFEHKTTLPSADRLTAPSIDLARKYHVSSKTIRDIWNGRSWNGITRNILKQVPRLFVDC